MSSLLAFQGNVLSECGFAMQPFGQGHAKEEFAQWYSVKDSSTSKEHLGCLPQRPWTNMGVVLWNNYLYCIYIYV